MDRRICEMKTPSSDEEISNLDHPEVLPVDKRRRMKKHSRKLS